MKPISLPHPDCELGYTNDQIKEMFGTVGYQMLLRFMVGQTMAHCSCKKYDHEKRAYVDTTCRHKPDTIIYPGDVRRFIEGRPVID